MKDVVQVSVHEKEHVMLSTELKLLKNKEHIMLITDLKLLLTIEHTTLNTELKLLQKRAYSKEHRCEINKKQRAHDENYRREKSTAKKYKHERKSNIDTKKQRAYDENRTMS